MPELPEVETITRQLDKMIAGKQITDFEVLNLSSFVGNASELIGQEIVSVSRRAKVVIIELSSGKYLIFHLKMTGQLILIDHKMRIAGGHADHEWHARLPTKHTRLIFTFDGDIKLYFNDLRKFGWCKLIDKKSLDLYFSKYGPDAYPDIDLDKFKNRGKRMPKSAIKKFILDQSVISGVGNIYADEALFDSRIHPKRLVSSITDTEWKTLADNIERILAFAISKGGTTDSDYVNAYGKVGGMQDYLKVYHKVESNCPNNCGGKIERIVVGGRGTHYCPICQKDPS